MDPFRKNISNMWVWPVSVIALLVGWFASVAWITDRADKGRLESLPVNVRERLMSGRLDVQGELVSLREEIEKLRAENSKLQTVVAEGSKGSEEIMKGLQSAKLFAGLTETEGPGLSVILRDSRRPVENVLDPTGGIIHDTDVLKIVNELWNAGAEAIAVNGKRVGPRTNFRCVGSTILVDSIKIATPIRIEVIGDQQTLLGAMNMPGGPLDEIRGVDPQMVEVVLVEKHRLSAYAGTMSSKYAKVAESNGTGRN
jgi:uncharacterized protein YlxW (UPF0749 family)